MSLESILAFQKVSHLLPADVPIILESPLGKREPCALAHAIKATKSLTCRASSTYREASAIAGLWANLAL